jgi:flagellar motor switch protein FliN/FliY
MYSEEMRKMSNLSQDEINRLLHGDGGGDTASDSVSADIMPDVAAQLQPGEEMESHSRAMPESDTTVLAQEELEKMYREDNLKHLTPDQVDALGEIGNICIGTSATTLNTLLGHRVMITTPVVEVYQAQDVLKAYTCPFLVVSVEFVEGVLGKNLLVLREYDAAVITDLLMGGEGNVDEANVEINELHLSAMSEIMNQMIGSAATAMSKMLGTTVNISPPKSASVDIGGEVGSFLEESDYVIKISFNMEIEGLLQTKLIQVMPLAMGKMLVNVLMGTEDSAAPAQTPAPAAAPAPAPQARPQAAAAPAAPPTRQPAPPPPRQQPAAQHQQPVDVKSVSYEAFGEPGELESWGYSGDWELVNDIPLSVTVELGKTKKNISQVLEFGNGSIIVLDKYAGDTVDVIVNGKRIAKGEVVVIDDNYGVRITEIFKNEKNASVQRKA